MAKVLIPRSDSVSAKVIEPSDFESMFSDDIINDYVRSGFTLTAGSGLAVNIAVGKARLKGLFIHNDSASSKSSLTASNTNYIYVTLTRDTNSEAESWDFTSNTTGSTPTDSLFIGTATTNGSSVTAVDKTDVVTQSIPTNIWGDGSDGDVTISSNTTMTEPKYYKNITINTGITLTGNPSPCVIFATGTVTINGTLTVAGDVSGGTGGAGGSACGTVGADGGIGEKGFENDSSAGTGDGATGGASGASSSGGSGVNAGGAGGTAGGSNKKYPKQLISKITQNVIANASVCGSGGAGGAGGGAGGCGHGTAGAGGSGGVGGTGGGSILIVAPTIILNTGSILNAVGGTGGDGGNGSGAQQGYYVQYQGAGGGSGGGGGNGGNGGSISLIYNTLTDNSTLNINGGSAGSGGGHGTGTTGRSYANMNGEDGTDGSDGTAGVNGIINKLQIS